MDGMGYLFNQEDIQHDAASAQRQRRWENFNLVFRTSNRIRFRMRVCAVHSCDLCSGVWCERRGPL